MSDERELSGLPADEAYWRDLETRIVSDLRPQLRAVALAPSATDLAAAWWTPLAARAWMLSGLAAAAVLAALLVAPPRTAGPQPLPAGLLALPDGDPAFAAFISAPEPPSVGTMVIASELESSR